MTRSIDAAGRTGVAAICFLVAMTEGFDIQAAGVAVPRLAPGFNLTPPQITLFLTMATVGLMLGALVGGRISDVQGRKIGLIYSMAFFGGFSLATAFAPNFELLVAARFLTGVGLGGALPNLVAIAAENCRRERTSTAVTAMYAGMPIGGAVAALASIFLARWSWTNIFVVGGLMPLIVLPVIAASLPALRPRPKELDAVQSQRAFTALLGPTSRFATVTLWVAFFFSLLILHLLLNWMPALLVARGMTKSQALLIQIAFNLSGAVGATFTGRALDRLDHRLVVGAVFTCFVLSLLMLAVTGGDFRLIIPIAAFAGIFVLGAQSVLYAIAPTFYSAEVRGVGVGAAVAAGRAGSIAGPIYAGALVTLGVTASSVFAATIPIALAGAFSTFALVAKPAKRSRHQLVPSRAQ